MPTATRVALAAAVIAICSAGSVLAQTAAMGASSSATPSGLTPDERASTVIRAIEHESAPTGAVPVDVAELARARAAGEWQTAARGAPIQVERYNATKKRRDGTATAGSEQTAAGVRGVQSKAEIAWSAPGEPRDYRTATESYNSVQ